MLIMETAATAATSSQVTAVLEVLGAVFTYLVGKIGNIVELIMGQPLLLIPIGITIGYAIFRFFRMIFRLAQLIGGVLIMNIDNLNTLINCISILIKDVEESDDLIVLSLLTDFLVKKRNVVALNNIKK